MSISKLFSEQLRQMAAGELVPADEGTGKLLAAEVDGLPIALAFSDHDRYSVALRRLEVGRPPVDGEPRAYLSATAAEIARRFSYLEEPLAVWELDGAERLAQLRSSPPLREGEELTYWEVTLLAGEQPGATMARYRWAPGMAEREPLDYPATFALVARMAETLAQALHAAE